MALFAFGLLSLVGDPRADAQGVPRPILPPVIMTPSSYLVADYDTTTLHAKWGLAIGQADGVDATYAQRVECELDP